MNQMERLRFKINEEEASNDKLLSLLEDAKDIILNKRFPSGVFPLNENQETFVEQKYLTLQILIAVEMFNKEGAEGETSHTEKDVSRSYDSSYISSDLLDQIMPMVNVL